MEINQLLNLSIRLAAPILLVALGGLFTLKVNIFNIALDGIMLMGCFGAVIAAHFLNSSGIGVLGGVLQPGVTLITRSWFWSLMSIQSSVLWQLSPYPPA